MNNREEERKRGKNWWNERDGNIVVGEKGKKRKNGEDCEKEEGYYQKMENEGNLRGK